MSKLETAKNLNDSAPAVEIVSTIKQLQESMENFQPAEQVKKAVEDLAQVIEPLAQAMVVLTDDTKETLAEINRKSQEQGDLFRSQIEIGIQAMNKATKEAQVATEAMDRANRRMDWKNYSLTVMTGIFTAVVVSVFWLYLAPPEVRNTLDPAQVAEYLRPALIEALVQ